MTSTPLDLFELLDVSRREDSYSSVLRQLLQDSPQLLRRVLEYGFGAACPVFLDVRVQLRRSLPNGAGVPDLLIVAHDAQRQRWELFVENKIDAGEFPGQTQGYLDACRGRAGERAAGIFLTLDGHPAQAKSRVAALSHAVLGGWVEASLFELSDPVVRVAAEAYVRRACVPVPEALPDRIVCELLEEPFGLLPAIAGVDALGRAIEKAAPSGWSHTALWIQSAGHSNPGLQFHRPGWVGTEIVENRFTRNNYNIHAELELVEEGAWRLKLHFETEPYMSKKWLMELDGVEELEAMRGAFRKAVHERADQLPGWTMTNFRLQICSFEMGASANSTVREVVASVIGALETLGLVADAALGIAKGDPRPSHLR